MFTHKGVWRYVQAFCFDCNKEKQVRIDAWNRAQQQWRCLSCATKKNFKDNPKLKEALKEKHITHGESRNKNKKGHWLYSRWQKMKARCKRWPTYLEKNIKVCSEWETSYVAFKQWAEANNANSSLELDRINNYGDYEPNNCRWVTHQENCNNRT